MGVQQAQKLKVLISPNGMQATIRLSPDSDYSDLTADGLNAALAEAKVKVTPEVEGQIKALCELIAADETPEDEFVLAQGQAAVEPVDARFEWSEKFDRSAGEDEEDEDRPVNFYEQTSIVTVDEGEEIGKVIPATKGQAGVNVLGEAVETTRTPVNIELGQRVLLGKDGQTVSAGVAGKVSFSRGQLRVDEVTTIKGNVDFECGNIDSSVGVLIHGTIQDKFKVTSKQSVTVGEHIEAATVKVGEDLSVRGGILGREKGLIQVEGEVTAKFCDAAHIEVGGQIIVAKEVINSKVATKGRLLVAHGSIIGGDIYAREGVEARYLGSEGMVKTTIVVGVPVDVLRKVGEINAQVKKQHEAADQIRTKVEPLLKMLKQLNPQQRERATELLAEADSIDFSVSDMEKKKTAMLEENAPSEGGASVLVLNKIYPGVTLQFEDRLVSFDEEKRGPILIERRRIKNVTEIVEVNQLTGSVFPLTARRVVGF